LLCTTLNDNIRDEEFFSEKVGLDFDFCFSRHFSLNQKSFSFTTEKRIINIKIYVKINHDFVLV